MTTTYRPADILALIDIEATAKWLRDPRSTGNRSFYEGKLAQAMCAFFGIDAPDELADLIADAEAEDAVHDAREARENDTRCLRVMERAS